jgi:glycosyltransferase involved in cell wall biosynthesis
VRILHVVAGEKWTGVAAVVHDWTRALAENGVEAQFAFVADSPLASRILSWGGARPLLTRRHGPLGVLRDARTLSRAIRREGFDLLHAHLTHDHWLSAFASRGAGARLVRTIHHRRHVRRDLLSRALASRTDAFAFANREIAGAFGAPGPILPPVVDSRVFSPGEKPSLLPGIGPLPAGALVLGTVAKIAAGRGHAEAIEAAAPLTEAVLLHVGKGELRPALEAAAAASGVAGRNFWAGYQDESLPLFYRAMDVFLFTASGSQQGQRAILEAMASS